MNLIPIIPTTWLDFVLKLVSICGAIYSLIKSIEWLWKKSKELYKEEEITSRKDTFLRFYIFTAVVITIIIWCILKLTTGDLQIKSILLLFSISAFLALVPNQA